jgi:TolB-like protein/Tfp pilus assembly protein PilF
MPALRLEILGGFELRSAAGDALRLPTRKSRALLAYLAVPPGQLHSREELATLLWGERADKQARHSLSQALSSIRKALTNGAGDALRVDGDRITLASSAVNTDVLRFERLVTKGSLESLARAADLYRGDLLIGIAFRAEAYEDWLAGERARLRELALGALGKLLDHHAAAGDAERGVEVAIRLLALDPLQEHVHRALMRLFMAAGRGDAALRQYERCREVLRRELGVEPEPKTQRLQRDIAGQRARGGASTAPVLPDKPSIAVLPFKNLSGDAGQDYFGAGVTDDIITELSRFHALFVIAGSTSFTYRDRAVDAKQVGRELGVRYVLEGGVRKAGDDLRVTVQLIDAAAGDHVWAERYDRKLADVFSIQDEVTRTIVATVVGRVEADGIGRARRKTPENMTAYDYVLRGLDFYQRRGHSPGDVARALAMFDKAIERDPELAPAYAWYACASSGSWFHSRDDHDLEMPLVYARKALSLDGNDCEAHRITGIILVQLRDYDRAWHHIERARALNPNHADAMRVMGDFLAHTGRPDEAVEWIEAAMRLNPHHTDWYCSHMGFALYTARRYAEALDAYRRITTPSYVDEAITAACLAGLKRTRETGTHARATLVGRPDFTVEWFGSTVPYKHEDDLGHLIAGLRKAGLPE